MGGSKYFYVSENKVYPIPHPKGRIYKPIEDLANKEVFRIALIYDTKERKPFCLRYISFDKIKLNKNGGYILTNSILISKTRNFFEYGFETPKALSKREDPWSIPEAPRIPSKMEIDTLKIYLKNNYPLLYKDFQMIMSITIVSIEAAYKSNIDLIKKAIQIRNKNSKNS